MNSLCFNVEKIIYTQKDVELDLNFIPANTRRRLNLFDKHVLFMINNCLSQDVENIVLSSQFGEFDRLLKLIEQYKSMNEVSPTAFSSSVHNFALGQLSLLRQITIPTVSIAGGKDSFESGLITSLVDTKKNIIFCYADNREDEFTGIALKIKNKENGFVIGKANNTKPANLKEIIQFFNNETDKISLSNFTIERSK